MFAQNLAKRQRRKYGCAGTFGQARERTMAGAARALRMSYMRAWTLIKTMNACFREPLIVVSRGGEQHGGAVLTEAGQAALKLYRQLEAQSLKAGDGSWRELRRLLKP